MVERQVVDWLVEIAEGHRQDEVLMTEIERVRPNPFAIDLNQAVVEAIAGQFRKGEREPSLLAARLPEGGLVDVDTPHRCEAARRAGVKVLKVTVIGKFIERGLRADRPPTLTHVDSSSHVRGHLARVVLS